MKKSNLNKGKPYKTTPYRKGCYGQAEYETLDVYGSNSPHKYYAITTRCDYFDKKGSFHEGYVLRVKWVSLEEFLEERRRVIYSAFGVQSYLLEGSGL